MEIIYKAGDIVVITATQQTGCGIKYLKKGSITKVAEDCSEWNSYIEVYRNKEAEENDRRHFADVTEIRPATECEVDMYNKEIYFINSVNTYS